MLGLGCLCLLLAQQKLVELVMDLNRALGN
jgi:hypothetical protein